MRSALQAQWEKTAEVIARHFPEYTRLNVPAGGLAMWIELPRKLSSKRVFDAGLQAQILVAPGLMFPNSLRFDAYLRISCGLPYSPEVKQALRWLAQLL